MDDIRNYTMAGMSSRFENQQRTIEAHNAKKNTTYKMGSNYFTGATQIGMGLAPQSEDEWQAETFALTNTSDIDNDGIMDEPPPSTLDYRSEGRNRRRRRLQGDVPGSYTSDSGVLPAIMNQGFCGSCYAIVAVTSVTALLAIESGVLLETSTEEILECDGQSPGGCDGGRYTDAWEWIYYHGVATMANYPYTAFWGESGPCQRDRTSIVSVILTEPKAVRLPANDEELLLRAVAHQPVAVAIHVSESLRACACYHSFTRAPNHATRAPNHARTTPRAHHCTRVHHVTRAPLHTRAPRHARTTRRLCASALSNKRLRRQVGHLRRPTVLRWTDIAQPRCAARRSA